MSIVMLFILLVTASLGNVLAGQSQYPFPVNCEEPRFCHQDLIPYCIKGRRDPVRGQCEFQEAICSGEELDPSNSCFLPYPVRCDLPAGQRLCFRDLRPFCVVGRPEPVRGHCAIQRAICDDGEEWDPSNSCFLPYAISCDEPADDRECGRDARPWCVVGRARPVRGHCAIQEAICDENAVLDISSRCLQ